MRKTNTTAAAGLGENPGLEATKSGLTRRYLVGKRAIEGWASEGIIVGRRQGKRQLFDLAECDRRLFAHTRQPLPQFENAGELVQAGYGTKRELAARYGVTVRSITAWMRKGLLLFFRVKRVVRFHLASCDASLRQHQYLRVEPNPPQHATNSHPPSAGRPQREPNADGNTAARALCAVVVPVLMLAGLLLAVKGRPSATPTGAQQAPLTGYMAALILGGTGLLAALNRVHCADVLAFLRRLPSRFVQAVVADPPYFRVLKHSWDNQWPDFDAYLKWSLLWLHECMRVLRDDGLCFVFGQVGKREWGFFDFCSCATHLYRFHDLLIWDRIVGYQRADSLDPAYEQVLVLRKSDTVRFFKGRVRTPYDADTIRRYQRDKRYSNQAARRRHLRLGKYARNIIDVASLRGSSREKTGHPSQKPLKLIQQLVLMSTDKGDIILDPFSGSGTTAVAAELLGRRWISIERKPKYCRMIERRLASVAALTDRRSKP